MAANLIIPVQELNAFDLPSKCIVTGAEEQVTFRPVKFSWYPPQISLLVFVPYAGLLVAVLLALVLRKRVVGELPFTDRGWRGWRQARWIWPLTVIVTICLVGGTLGAVAASREGAEIGAAIALVMLAVTIALPLGVYFGYARQRLLRVTKVTDQDLHLRIPQVAVATAFREHLHVPPAEPILQATRV